MKKISFAKSICAVSLAAVCVCGLAACSSSSSESDSESEGLTGGVAATVNGVEIDEDTITEAIESARNNYINMYYYYMGEDVTEDKTDEEVWADYLDTYGYTPEELRDEYVNKYIDDELVLQYADELGVSVDDETIDAEVQKMRDNYDSDEEWKNALDRLGITENDYRDEIKLELTQEEALDTFATGDEDEADEVGDEAEELGIETSDESNNASTIEAEESSSSSTADSASSSDESSASNSDGASSASNSASSSSSDESSASSSASDSASASDESSASSSASSSSSSSDESSASSNDESSASSSASDSASSSASSSASDDGSDEEADDEEVTDEELLEYAQENAKDLYDGAKRSSHVLFDAEDADQAEEVLSEIKSGKLDIADAAEQYSIDTGSAAEGGDVGWDKLTSFVDEYQEALDGLSKDQVSDLVESDYGIHIIECTDVFNVPDEITSISSWPDEFIDDMKDKIVEERENAAEEAQEDAYNDWLDECREKADIVINDMPENVPYNVDVEQLEEAEDENGEGDSGTDDEGDTDSDDNTAADDEEETDGDSSDSSSASSDSSDSSSASSSDESSDSSSASSSSAASDSGDTDSSEGNSSSQSSASTSSSN